MQQFTPPEGAKRSIRQPNEGWISCGWLAFEAWRLGNAQTYQNVADALAVTKPAISNWKAGRLPGEATRKHVELLADVPPDAWTWWVRSEGAADSSPESERRPSAPEALRELGTTRDELRATVRSIDRVRAKGGLSPAQEATLLGKRTSALTALARLEERQSLEDHPDFDALLEDIIGAVVDVLGPDAPEGIEARIADQLEARAQMRAQRRVAA